MDRETARLFPPGYWDEPEPTERKIAIEKAISLQRTAENLRDLASRGMHPRKYPRAADAPAPQYYALAAGAKYLQAVLLRAMKDGDLAVAAEAIKALSRVAGAENLVAAMDGQGGAQPLVSALTFPARTIRYLAAEALAQARPKRRFTGWHLVVPVLVEAVRQTGAPTAVLVDPDLDRRNQVKDLLRGAGCNVIDGEAFGAALDAAQAAGGADMLVLSSEMGAPGFGAAVARVRSQAVMSRMPIVLIARSGEMLAARNMAKRDALVVAIDAGKVDAAAVTAAMATLKAAGGSAALTDQQAGEWAVRAANALSLLAVTRNPVYDLSGATKSLIAALKDKRDAVRIATAGALAQFPDPEAQRGIADLADDASASEAVRLAAYAAVSESVRRFGKLLTDAQIRAVVAVVAGTGSLKIREGAAQALGALNLPSEKIKELILSVK